MALLAIMAFAIVSLCKTSAFRHAQYCVGMKIVELIADIPYKSQRNVAQVDSCERKAVDSCRMLATFLKHNPSVLRDRAAMRSLVEMLGADEWHVTDRRGIIEYSSVDSLLGYDMKSSPQSDQFMPAVVNPSFAYIQNPCRRGVDGLCFVYIGVSRLDSPGIVQIGYRMEAYNNRSLRNLSVVNAK